MLKYFFKNNLKLIIGSGGTKQSGFISSDIDWLDITKWWHWYRSFRPNSLKNIVAEHVFEHLSKKELNIALKLIYKFLRQGGKLRLAIPDKNRKDTNYVNAVKPPKDGHKTYMNFEDISRSLKSVGFKVVPIEFFDKKGVFHHIDWKSRDGIIKRSFKYDSQHSFKKNNYFYTSLIVDAIK